jgi:hypothetical protein
MAVSTQTSAITRALIALLTALVEVDQALLELVPSQNDKFRDHIEASHRARDECFQQVKKLVELMEKDHE